ncbi:MAG: sulfite exporter TauE/SafE family protein [Planctomycetaceae bacterium]|nr:sulfite exporter TauE/SafE family protein [Planctomycetaceae bacterium]
MWLFLFGTAVGVLGGLLGIGGGIALVPGLMYFFGFSQQQAQGTSLAVMIPPIGIFAAYVYYRNGYVQIPVVGWVAAGFIVGALGGAKLIPFVPLPVLRVSFGALLLYTGFLFILNPAASKSAAAMPSAIATILTLILGRILGKKLAEKRKAIPPPSSEIEYHI